MGKSKAKMMERAEKRAHLQAAYKADKEVVEASADE